MILWDVSTGALRDAVLAQLAALPKGLVTDLRAAEFDGWSYNLRCEPEAPDKLHLCVALPKGAEPKGAAEAAVKALGSGVCAQAPAVPQGFSVALVVDLSKAPSDDEGRQQFARRVGSVRSAIAGAPLREALEALAAGGGAGTQAMGVAYRPGEKYFIKRGADSVTVVFPMAFKDANDGVIARTFLKEFSEARRAQALGAAPGVSWAPPESPPLELDGTDAPRGGAGANGGYVSFVLFQRHVGTPAKIEAAAWHLATFYGFVSYHIKCSKGHMHTRMRKRVQALVGALERSQIDYNPAKRGDKPKPKNLLHIE